MLFVRILLDNNGLRKYPVDHEVVRTKWEIKVIENGSYKTETCVDSDKCCTNQLSRRLFQERKKKAGAEWAKLSTKLAN